MSASPNSFSSCEVGSTSYNLHMKHLCRWVRSLAQIMLVTWFPYHCRQLWEEKKNVVVWCLFVGHQLSPRTSCMQGVRVMHPIQTAGKTFVWRPLKSLNAWWGSHCIAAASLKGIRYHIWAKMTLQPHAVASATAGVGSAQKDTHHDMELYQPP